MNNRQVCLTVDDYTISAVQEMPRKLSASSLFRHLMKAGTMTDEQWSEYKKTDEAQQSIGYLKKYRTRLAGK